MIADDLSGPHPWWFTFIYNLLNAPLGVGNLLFVTVTTAVPTFVVVYVVGKPLIEELRRVAARQTAYEDAPETHRAKTGTPTMGGLLFLAAPVIALLARSHARHDRARGAVPHVHGDRFSRRPGEDSRRAQSRAGRTPQASGSPWSPQSSSLAGGAAIRQPGGDRLGPELAVVRARGLRSRRHDARGQPHRRARRARRRRRDPAAGRPRSASPGSRCSRWACRCSGPRCSARSRASWSTTGIRRSCSWATPVRSRWAARWRGSPFSTARSCC